MYTSRDREECTLLRSRKGTLYADGASPSEDPQSKIQGIYRGRRSRDRDEPRPHGRRSNPNRTFLLPFQGDCEGNVSTDAPNNREGHLGRNALTRQDTPEVKKSAAQLP